MKLDKIYTYAILLFLGSLSVCYGQQLPQFSQYMYNTIAVNPAYAGSKETINIMALHRSQWVGVNGAPQTQFFSIHAPISEQNLGGGISVVNDQLGYENSSYIYGDLSYTIETSYESLLSFGIKVGTSHYSLDESLLSDPEVMQDNFFNNDLSHWNFNIGAGLYFRTEEWYIGVSVPKLINNDNNRNAFYRSLERVNYFINGGFIYEFSPWVKFKPTFLVKMTNGAPISVDATLNFLLKENVWLGATYRHGDAFGAIAMFNLTENFKIGYAYEYNTSKLSEYSIGSHEILLTYDIKFRYDCRCPQYF